MVQIGGTKVGTNRWYKGWYKSVVQRLVQIGVIKVKADCKKVIPHNTNMLSSHAAPAHKAKRVPTSKRAPHGLKGTPRSNNTTSTVPNLDNCAQHAFKDGEDVKGFIRTGRFYIYDLPDTSPIRQAFKSFPFAFHKPEFHAADKHPVLTTKSGWAMLPDQNAMLPMLEAVEMLKNLGIDFSAIALESFGIKHGYMALATDRWKSQPVGPGFSKDIVHACWKKANSLHVDIREENEEHQLAFLFNFGEYSRHMVITDLTLLETERRKLKRKIALARAQFLEDVVSEQHVQLLVQEKVRMGERHMRIYELLNHVQQHRRGCFSGFTTDEKLLIKPILKAIEIRPGQALLFGQFLPHCLTNSTTSTDPDARADTFYIGLKIAEQRNVLEPVMTQLIDMMAEGGQHTYQCGYGRNGFTDKGINEEHQRKLLPCIFAQYNIPPMVGGKDGISKNHPLPTVAQFVRDVKAARENPHLFAPGMTCDHLDIDNVLIARNVLEKTMEILQF